MNSPLIDLETSTEYPSPSTSKRNLKDIVRPFSPIRKRKTPESPPKVTLNLRNSKTGDLIELKSKNENLIPSNGRITIYKNRNCIKDTTTKKIHKMNDFSMDIDNDDHMFKKQLEVFAPPITRAKEIIDFSKDLLDFSEHRTTIYGHVGFGDSPESGNKQCKINSDTGFSSVRSYHEKLQDELPASSRYNSILFKGKKGICKRLYEDLLRAEEAEEMGPYSRYNKAKMRLALEWNWLISWLEQPDNGRNKSKIGQMRRKMVSKRTGLKKKQTRWVQKRQLQKQKLVRNALNKKRRLINKRSFRKIGEKQFTSVFQGRPKLAKNEGVDIAAIRGRTKIGNNASRRNNTQILLNRNNGRRIIGSGNTTKRNYGPRNTLP